MGTLYIEDVWNVFVDNWKTVAAVSGILAAIIGVIYFSVWGMAKAGASEVEILEALISLVTIYTLAYFLAQIYVYRRADGQDPCFGKTLAAAVNAIIAQIIVSVVILLVILGLIVITAGAAAINVALGVIVGILAFVAGIVIVTIIILKMIYISVLAAQGLSIGEILRKAYSARLGPAGKAIVGAFIVQLLVGAINNTIQAPIITKIAEYFMSTHGAGIEAAIAAIPASDIVLAIIVAWITLILGAIIWFFPYVSVKDAIPEKA
ncbi:MAG: hypothetical protein GXN93_01335 [Candidatus Diapherotrites archaeon]|nr:hypothetical protein [Candidatus Diapherotrites archaeon]